MSTREDTITVSVKLMSTLKRYRPAAAREQTFTVELPRGGTVADLIDRLAIPRPMAKLVFVNHTQLRADDVLTDGVLVEMFPPIAGG